MYLELVRKELTKKLPEQGWHLVQILEGEPDSHLAGCGVQIRNPELEQKALGTFFFEATYEEPPVAVQRCKAHLLPDGRMVIVESDFETKWGGSSGGTVVMPGVVDAS